MTRTSSMLGLTLVSLATLAACGSSTPDANNGVVTADAVASTAPTSAPTGTAATVAPTTSASSAAKTAPAEGIWRTETLGGVALGAATSDVEKLLGKPEKTSPPTEEGATGDWTFAWTYVAKGISIQFAGPKKEGPHYVKQMWIDKTSKLKTGSGIGVGSTKAEVEKAYGKDIDKDGSSDTQIGVGPDHYDRMTIQLEKGAVVGVTIGADGE